MSFQIGDRIAHPLHGAGVIDRIESRRIGRESREYFVQVAGKRHGRHGAEKRL